MKKSVHLLVRAALLSLAICAIPFIAQSAAATQSSMLPMVTTLKASRLDAHDGQMKQNAKNLMAYKNDDCTGQLNHYIVAGDWYNIDKVCSNSTRELHYPITVKNGNNDTTEDHYFSGVDFLANSDGSAGNFSTSIGSSIWYSDTGSHPLPANMADCFKYYDDRTDNGGEIYVSNNKSFFTNDGTYNNKLCCADGNTIMSAPTTPSTPCYYDHSDLADADYSWNRAKQSWCKTWIIQGTNTVYCAGTDASGNYATAQYLVKYDNKAPYCNKPTLKSIKTSGFTAYVDGVGDATSGVASVTLKVYTKADKSDAKTYTPVNQGSGAWCCSVSTSSFSSTSGTYVIVADVVDNAGNTFEITSNGTVPTTTSSTPSSSSTAVSSSSTSTSSSISDYTPTCDFGCDSPIKVNADTNAWWTSDAGSKTDRINKVLFSVSSDGGNTWSDETARPPESFDTVGKYEIRMRAHAYICDKWSDYAEHDCIVYDLPVAPTALFTVTSPVACGTQLNITDSSHVNSASDRLGTYEWSYSIDDKTWTTLSGAPDSFDLSEFSSTTLHATYYIRLRVETQGSDYVAAIWSTYCEQSVVVYRVNTEPSALFNVNSSYKTLDVDDKSVKDIYTGYDADGDVCTYFVMKDGTVKHLVGDGVAPFIDSDLSNAKSIAVNGEYLYAVLEDNSLISKDTVSGTEVTQSITGVNSVVSVGSVTYAIATDGTVRYKKTDNAATGWQTLSLTNIKQIVADKSDGVSAALDSSGNVYCWYDYNSSSSTFSPSIKFTSARDITAGTTAGGNGISALVGTTVKGWIVSTNSTSSYSTGVSYPYKIVIGTYLYVIDSSGNVTNSSSGTVDTSGLSNIGSLAIAYSSSKETAYSLSSSGSVKVWGANPLVYTSSNSKYQTLPNDVPFLMQSTIKKWYAGGYGIFANMSDGYNLSWGDNTYNFYGKGDSATAGYEDLPSTKNLSDISYMATYTDASYYIDSSGNLYQNGTKVFVRYYDSANYGYNGINQYINHTYKYLGCSNASKVVQASGNSESFLVLKKDGTLAHSYADINIDPFLAGWSAWSGGNNCISSYDSTDKYGNYYINDYIAADATNYTISGDSSVSKIYAKDIACVGNVYYVLSSEGKLYTYSFNTQESSCSVYNTSGTETLGYKYYQSLVTNSTVDSSAVFTYTGISGLSSIYSISSGLCGITTDNNLIEQAGKTTITLLSNVVKVAGSDNFGMALTSSGKVYTWGVNSDGELGQGNTTTLTWPKVISTLSGVVDIAAGNKSAYAITDDSSVYSWGDNVYGELGNGNYSDLYVPTIIPLFSYSSTIPAIFPTETISYTDFSDSGDSWDSIANDEWQYSLDGGETWKSGKPTSFSWDDLGDNKYKETYIRRRVTDVGNSPYSPAITTSWLVERVMLCDPRPNAQSVTVTNYTYEQNSSNYWIKQGADAGVEQNGGYPSIFLFAPDTAYLALDIGSNYSSGTTPEVKSKSSGTTTSGSLFSTCFTNDGISLTFGKNYVGLQSVFGTLADGTNAELATKYALTSLNSGNTYCTDGDYNSSGTYIHVDGKAPTGTASITSNDTYTYQGSRYGVSYNYSYTTYSINANVSDTESGVANVYADIYNSFSQTTSRVSLTNNGSSWGITEIGYYQSYPLVLKDVYAVDNVGNSALLYSSNLTIGATLAPNPAKQGEQIAFTMTTTGSPNDIDIAFPSSIYSLDNTISSGTVSIPVSGNGGQLTTNYNYTLPSNTPPTLDANGNRLLNPYSFTITAKDASGNTASCQVTLDVKQTNNLTVAATLTPNPAKQGQQVTFDMVTTGSPTKLTIMFPSGISSNDETGLISSTGTIGIPLTSPNPSGQDTLYNYTLGMKVPLTLDKEGNRLLSAYSFTITATDAIGKTATCTATLDVQNNIYTGFRTRFIN